MKSKKLVYFLVLLTVTLWGGVFYQIFTRVGSGDEPVLAKEPTPARETLNDYAAHRDTARLLLDYRDPFSAPKSEPVEIPVSHLVHKSVMVAIPKPSINWSVIKYSGFIHNPGSKKLIAMISINGKELMLSEGETADQVKLVRNMKDSVKVTYQGSTKFITLNNNSQ